MRYCLTLLLLTSPALAEEKQELSFRLEPFRALIGGSWVMDGELPGGQKVRSRLMAERGLHGGHVRLRSYIAGPIGEVLMYQTYVFWHPADKQLQYITFAADGGVVRGAVTTGPGEILMEQKAQGRYPPMRMRYEFEPERIDTYKGTTQLKMGENWTSQETTATRELAGPKKVAGLKSKSDQLDPFAKLIGGRWEKSGKMPSGAKVNGYNIHDWTLPGRVLESKIYRRTKEGPAIQAMAALHYWDPERKQVGIIFFGRGSIGLGKVTVDGDRREYEWTTYGDATTTKLKEKLHFKDNDHQVWTMYVERDGKWTPVTGEVTNTRVPPK